MDNHLIKSVIDDKIPKSVTGTNLVVAMGLQLLTVNQLTGPKW